MRPVSRESPPTNGPRIGQEPFAKIFSLSEYHDLWQVLAPLSYHDQTNSILLTGYVVNRLKWAPSLGMLGGRFGLNACLALLTESNERSLMIMLQHALTVDVEDYFHVAALADTFPPHAWGQQELRVVASTQRLLDLFSQRSVKATFFVLGWVAERAPDLVKRIAAEGHEVASHGYSHQLVYEQTPEVFRQETQDSKKLLEDITGEAIKGYRAASYSITRRNLWALDILADIGFSYDSSIFPVYHDRYGIPNTPRKPYRLKTETGRKIIEFPITTADVLGYKLPIAGGGYFRIFPYALSRWGLRRATAQTGAPFVFYLHPWEIDPEQPRVKTNLLSRFRHYTNLSRCENRLRQLTQDFSFTTMADALDYCDANDGFTTFEMKATDSAST